MNQVEVTRIPGSRDLQFNYQRLPEEEHLVHSEWFSLYQLGDLKCHPSFELNEHAQLCFEISYIASGKGWFETDGIRTDVSAGDIYINRPGEVHSGGADPSDPYRYYYMGFHLKIGEGDSLRAIRDFFHFSNDTVVKDRMDLYIPFMNAIKELNGQDDFSSHMFKTYLEQIFILTYRNFQSSWQSKYPGSSSENEVRIAVHAAVNMIDQKLLQMKELSEVSEAIGYSLSHLSFLFRKEMGISLQKYFMQRKWEKSIELLRSGYSMTEIAKMLQYASVQTFSRAFKNQFKVSPSEYVKLHFE